MPPAMPPISSMSAPCAWKRMSDPAAMEYGTTAFTVTGMRAISVPLEDGAQVAASAVPSGEASRSACSGCATREAQWARWGRRAPPSGRARRPPPTMGGPPVPRADEYAARTRGDAASCDPPSGSPKARTENPPGPPGPYYAHGGRPSGCRGVDVGGPGVGGAAQAPRRAPSRPMRFLTSAYRCESARSCASSSRSSCSKTRQASRSERSGRGRGGTSPVRRARPRWRTRGWRAGPRPRSCRHRRVRRTAGPGWDRQASSPFLRHQQ